MIFSELPEKNRELICSQVGGNVQLFGAASVLVSSDAGLTVARPVAMA